MIEPHLPNCATGRPREWPMREIIDGMFYVMRAGCPWRLMPSDLPPWGTIYRWFAAWRDEGRFERINHALVMADRERVGREPARPRRSSTARASRPPRPAGHAVMMRERRSKDASAMRWSTPTGAALSSNRIPPASRTATVADPSAGFAPHLPVHPAGLRRQRVCRRESRQGHVDRGRDRAQEPRSGRLRR